MTNEATTQTTTTGKAIKVWGRWYMVEGAAYATLAEAQAHDERIAKLAAQTQTSGASHFTSPTSGNWTGD